LRIYLTDQAIRVTVYDAIIGYEVSGKEEAGGQLLGYQDRNSFYVEIAEPYITRSAPGARMPSTTRTRYGPNPIAFERKGQKLEEDLCLPWIGVYHTHVEIAGTINTGQSDEDEELHVKPVDLIVSITNRRMSFPKYSLPVKYHGKYRNFNCCIRGWIRDTEGKSREVPVSRRKVLRG
jgi:hypothetical protein